MQKFKFQPLISVLYLDTRKSKYFLLNRNAKFVTELQFFLRFLYAKSYSSRTLRFKVTVFANTHTHTARFLPDGFVPKFKWNLQFWYMEYVLNLIPVARCGLELSWSHTYTDRLPMDSIRKNICLIYIFNLSAIYQMSSL